MKSYAKIILILLIPLTLVIGYALSSLEIGSGDWMLEKADLSEVERMFPILFAEDEDPEALAAARADSVRMADSLAHIEAERLAARMTDSLQQRMQADSLRRLKEQDSISQANKPIRVAKPDLSKFRVLILGDSMLEWLAKRLCDYTMENGYDLSSIVWYSSSTKLWATTDTLDYFLDRIQPDYVILCLGANELFVRDLPKREKYITTIMEKLGSRPFFWIGPPNWKKDTGINDLICSKVGKGRFFDSRNLELERAEDNMHPTRYAAAKWMDTIAVWMNSPEAAHPLLMNRPQKWRHRRYHHYILKPPH